MALLKSAHAWISESLFSMDAFIQLFIITFTVLLSYWVAQRTFTWLSKPLANLEKWRFIRLYVTPQEFMFLLYSVPVLWLSVFLGESLKQNIQGINIFASLLTAWGVIRLLSCTIKSTFWSKSIAIIVWGWAALSILGFLDDAQVLFDSVAINLGNYRLSFLVFLKGFVVLGVLLWIANALVELLNRFVFQNSDLTLSQKVLFNKATKILFITIALLMTLSVLGVDLMALTVFSGALGLGIGIGLQKVFSNLVSGFVLLMDKSIKPGDVIAVGETYGWVNKLSARHVSLLTRDGKEHLIPNENLIIEQVENWSYSDEKIRLHISVGISYKSDILKAKELMLAATKEQPRILTEPQPVCLIIGFGDSSVDFELRAWIADPENGIGNVKSAVYESIWFKFKENHIEIPFPQRDVHIKSGPSTKLMQQGNV